MKRFVCACLAIVMLCMFTGCSNEPELPSDMSMPEYSEEIQNLMSNEELMDELNTRFMNAFGNYDTDGMSVFLTFDDNAVVYVAGLTTVYASDADYDVESLKTLIEFDMSQSHNAINETIDWLRVESGIDDLILRVMYITADSSEIIRYEYPSATSV